MVTALTDNYLKIEQSEAPEVFRYTSYDQHHSVHGQKIEEAVKTKVREMFSGTGQSFWQKFTKFFGIPSPWDPIHLNTLVLLFYLTLVSVKSILPYI